MCPAVGRLLRKRHPARARTLSHFAQTRESAARRGYGPRWRREREAYLRAHPLCVMCRARGVVAAATVVDHVVPHKGDARLFWDQANWQGLCQTDHNAAKKSLEATGHLRGCDANGLPLDPSHHWSA